MWRSKLAENQKLTMTALRLGELSMVIAPYELFSRSAQEIKTNTPFPMTFVLGYTNSIAGYIPTEEGYEYNNGVGCYEAYSSSWPKGAAEALTEGYLQMLNQLKK